MDLYKTLVLVAAWSSMALAYDSTESAALRRFREICRQNRMAMTLDQVPELRSIRFFPLGVTQSAQGRFSLARSLETLAKAESRQFTAYTRRKQEPAFPVFPEKNGQSIYDFDRPALGVFRKGKIYLSDGNHKAIVSTVMDAAYMPIEIIRIWNDTDSDEKFQDGMEAEGLGYWRDENGNRLPLLDLCDLIEDPNLQLARLEILRVEAIFEEGTPQVLDVDGAKRANAIKINGDIPFFEILYADALRRGGEVWSNDLTEKDLKISDFKRHLRIVKQQARLDPKSSLNRILLLSKPLRASQIDCSALVTAHVKKFGDEVYKLGREAYLRKP